MVTCTKLYQSVHFYAREGRLTNMLCKQVLMSLSYKHMSRHGIYCSDYCTRYLKSLESFE